MIYFISGHRDITKEEFKKYYIPKINKVIQDEMDDEICDTRAFFIVGDYEGVDIMAQNWLCDNGYAEKVQVYHMFEKPRHYDKRIVNLPKGGYTTDIERDSTMTRESDFDIAYVRKGKWNSGTAQNIKRRCGFE